MKITIVCESVTGNTAQLAEALKFHLRRHEVTLLTQAPGAATEQDVLFAGCWTDKGDCTPAMAAFLEKLEHQNVFLFGTCGYGGSEEYFDTVYRRFAAHVKASNTILGHYICQGRMPVTVVQRYEAMLEANPGSERWMACIANYNQALAHPNEADLAALKGAADQALAQL